MLARHVCTLEVVVVGVLSHASVEERPGQVVHCILLVLNRLGHHLRVEMVVEAVIQMGLRSKAARSGRKDQRAVLYYNRFLCHITNELVTN